MLTPGALFFVLFSYFHITVVPMYSREIGPRTPFKCQNPQMLKPPI